MAASLEVTDAQTRLERARDNQTAALYNYNVARIDLAQAMGRVPRSMSAVMKKRIIPICSGAGGGGRGRLLLSGRRERRRSNRIMVSGNIELTEVNIAFKTPGRLVERTVDEGDAVKKGQVVARLDRDQLLRPARARGGGAGSGAVATGAGGNRRRVAAGHAGGGPRAAARRPGVQRGAGCRN